MSRAWASATAERATQRRLEAPGLAAVLERQTRIADHHAAVDRLQHVVDGQRRDRDRGQRLHLDAGRAGGRRRGASIVDAPAAASARGRPSTAVSASGWQSGISSAVRLAAMIPASRATPSTSPLAAPPARRGRASRAPWRPRRARRRRATVAGLSDTSTIRACAAGVEMGEPGHHPASGVQGLRSSSRVATSTLASRISVSPTRKQRTP